MNSLVKNSNKILLLANCSKRSMSTLTGVIPNDNSHVTICPKEMELFNELSKIWWDVEGPMKLLHKMTPVRIDILKKHLQGCGKIDLNRVDPRKPFEGLNILEVGCGGGILSEALAEKGAKVTGVDAAQTLLSVAEEHLEKCPSLGQNLKYINETIEEFSQKNQNAFDVLIASEVIEHVADKESFAKFSIDCLRPGGSVFFTTMNRTPPSGIYYIFLFENFFNAIPKGAHEYEKFMRPEEMEAMFRRNKCKTTDVQGYVPNVLTYNWFEVPFTTFNFAMHAIKQ